MMPSDFHDTLFQTEQRLNARITRVEETIYGDGKSNRGLVADVKIIAETILGKQWQSYALIALIALEAFTLVLIVLLFIRVY